MKNMSQPIFSRTPALAGSDIARSRDRILAHFHQTFDRYEQLFDVLACDEAYYKKPIALRHPLIFYFGHTATFFINKLLLVGLVSERINPRFESMFAIGVDEMSWDDLNEANYAWPTVAEVEDQRVTQRDRLFEIRLVAGQNLEQLLVAVECPVKIVEDPLTTPCRIGIGEWRGAGKKRC